MIFEIKYISGNYYDDKQKVRKDKIKSFKQIADSKNEAITIFTNTIKKQIINIKELSDNTLGSLCPELEKLLEEYKKLEK